MTSIDSAKEMLMISDYPFDQVVLLKSGSFTLPASSSGYLHSFDHGLSFTPLCGGNWSMQTDFSIQYEYSSGTFPSGLLGVLFQRTINVFATSDKVYLSCDNNSSTVTIYYRVYGFEPKSSSSLISPIASLGGDMTLSSDYGNPKLYLDNCIDLPSTGGSVQLVNVIHNIGTHPQTMGWVTYDTYNGSTVEPAVHPIGSTNGASEGITLVINEVEIVWVLPPFIGAHRAYYRIYLDS